MEIEFVQLVLAQAPTVAGLAVWALMSERRCNRLIDAMIARENCEDDDAPTKP